MSEKRTLVDITWPDPAVEVKPLPRWTPLPGDPPDLRRWLAARAAQDGASS